MKNDKDLNNLIENEADIELNQPSKSRFLFFLGFFGFFLFMAGCFSGLWTERYDSNADVEVPESATYNPKYK
jgi:hypothetical protein